MKYNLLFRFIAHTLVGEGKMETNDQIYKCQDCGSETAETKLVGRKDEQGFFILYCDCGSRNISLKLQDK